MVNVTKGVSMLKIKTEALVRSIEELRTIERRVAGKRNEILENARKCQQSGYEVQGRRLENAAEGLVERRRNIYELILSLERIKSVYQDAENSFSEALDGNYTKATRDADYITIAFPEEVMEVIRHIKV